MKVLITEKLSPNKMKTPEGYLICKDAVLARTGPQEYLKSELYPNCFDNTIISVDRKPEQVFSEATIASFENKPLTCEHPEDNVNPYNYRNLSVGFVRDVHRGKYNNQDVLLGTLVVTDATIIEDIENGIRTELSCGYDCDITDEEYPQQINIRGNHVALCEEGRAGIAKIVDSKKRLKDAEFVVGSQYEDNNGNIWQIVKIDNDSVSFTINGNSNNSNTLTKNIFESFLGNTLKPITTEMKDETPKSNETEVIEEPIKENEDIEYYIGLFDNDKKDYIVYKNFDNIEEACAYVTSTLLGQIIKKRINGFLEFDSENNENKFKEKFDIENGKLNENAVKKHIYDILKAKEKENKIEDFALLSTPLSKKHSTTYMPIHAKKAKFDSKKELIKGLKDSKLTQKERKAIYKVLNTINGYNKDNIGIKYVLNKLEWAGFPAEVVSQKEIQRNQYDELVETWILELKESGNHIAVTFYIDINKFTVNEINSYITDKDKYIIFEDNGVFKGMALSDFRNKVNKNIDTYEKLNTYDEVIDYVLENKNYKREDIVVKDTSITDERIDHTKGYSKKFFKKVNKELEETLDNLKENTDNTYDDLDEEDFKVQKANVRKEIKTQLENYNKRLGI